MEDRVDTTNAAVSTETQGHSNENAGRQVDIIALPLWCYWLLYCGIVYLYSAQYLHVLQDSKHY